MIVGNENVKKLERQSASAYFTWDITWTLCNACNPTFSLTGQVRPMLMSSVLHARSTLDRKAPFLNWLQNFFKRGVIFMFWHDIVYRELLYCVTNFELVCTWNKVAVIENAKACRVYPTFPYLHFSLKIITLNISKTRANLNKLSTYLGSATSIYPKIDLTVHAKNFLLTSVVNRPLTVSKVHSCFATN